MELKKISKFLSYVLRHKPSAAGIELDKHGWADVNQLIDGVNRTGKYELDFSLLEFIVENDNKQRYSFNESKTCIRANQGHSINVDVELEEVIPPEVLFHGTGEKYVKSINAEGLKSQSRLYVHISKDKDTAINVGKRHGKPVIYKIRSGDMYRDGYKFYLSKNGVWLTKEVPPCYLILQ